jgi:hypothetical protein
MTSSANLFWADIHRRNREDFLRGYRAGHQAGTANDDFFLHDPEDDSYNAGYGRGFSDAIEGRGKDPNVAWSAHLELLRAEREPLLWASLDPD